MESGLLISDAAKEVQVESHVLRYWEEELQLPIRRNEQGHRYYTEEDVERFKQIKNLKESGLQLKAIRMILKDGKFDVLSSAETAEDEAGGGDKILDAVMEVASPSASAPISSHEVTQEEKTQKLQWILQQMIRQAVQQNNAELVQQIRESVLKELDYQFRMQTEREEERAQKAMEREEEHYKKVDELLRKKNGPRNFFQNKFSGKFPGKRSK